MKALFGGTYAGRKVLVTGHTGFKGSWLCLWLTRLGAQVMGLALAPDTSPAHWSLLDLKSVRELNFDIRDRARVKHALETFQPEMIFHLAAQPLVRRGYREPLLTFETNILGLINLLEAVRGLPSARVLINVTSDKVYREQIKGSGYQEDDPLGGYDPYSASKACSELVTACYRSSFLVESGLRVVTARAGNVIGGGDWSEDRLVPDFVRAASAGQVLQIRNPDAVRPWQHVLEPLSGYLRLGQTLWDSSAAEGAWNFGPAEDASITVRNLVSQMRSLWPVEFHEYSPGQQPRETSTLLLDSSKAIRELQWRPVWDIGKTLEHTFQWYHAFYSRGQLLTDENLNDYIANATAAGLAWAK